MSKHGRSFSYQKLRQHWPKKGDKLPDYYYEQQTGQIGNALGINDFWDNVQVEIKVVEDKRRKYWYPIRSFKRERI